jgi:hypothetical protein
METRLNSMALFHHSDADIDTEDVGNTFHRKSVTYLPRYTVSQF